MASPRPCARRSRSASRGARSRTGRATRSTSASTRWNACGPPRRPPLGRSSSPRAPRTRSTTATPGLTKLGDIRAVIAETDRPLNVLALPEAPPVAQLAEAGVARISIGGGFAYVAMGAVVRAANELRDDGTYGFWETAAVGAKAWRDANR